MAYYDPPADLTSHGAILRIDQKLPALVDGKLPVDIGGGLGSNVTVVNDDGSPVPVSDAGGSITIDAVSLPLPTGAATEAKQDTLIGHVDGVEGLLTSLDGKSPALIGGRVPVDLGGTIEIGSSVEISNDVGNPIPMSDAGGSITVDGPLTDAELRASAVPVSLASAPLPTGAATAANQSTLIGHVDGIEGLLSTIDADTSTLAGAVSGTELQVDIVSAPTITVSDGGSSLTVDGTVGISGTVPVSAASLPLPSGAATAANQTTGNTSLSTLNTNVGAQADAAATTDTGSFSLLAFIKRGLQNWTTLLGRVPTLTVTSTRLLVDGSGVTQPVSDAGGSITVDDGGSSLTVDGTVAISGTVPVSAVSLPLPSGAATSALQTTGNSSLSSIDGKTPALVSGQVPVVQNLLFTPTTTSVVSSATSVTLLAANSSRKGLFISNLGNGILYISFTSPATTANCFTAVYPGGTLSLDTTMFGNALYGIWSSADGTAQVTEFT